MLKRYHVVVGLLLSVLAQSAIAQKQAFVEGQVLNLEQAKSMFGIKVSPAQEGAFAIAQVAVRKGCDKFQFQIQKPETRDNKEIVPIVISARENIPADHVCNQSISDCVWTSVPSTTTCEWRNVSSTGQHELISINKNLPVEIALASINQTDGTPKFETLASYQGKLDQFTERLQANSNQLRACSSCVVDLANQLGVKLEDAKEIACKLFFSNDFVDDLKKSIEESKEISELKKIFHSVSDRFHSCGASFADAFNAIRQLVTGRETELQGSELETLSNDLDSIETLQALYKHERRVKMLAARNKDKDSAEQALLKKFYDRAYQLHEAAITSAETVTTLRSGVEKLRDFVSKSENKDRVDMATRFVMKALRDYDKARKSSDDVSSLITIANRWNSKFGNHNDYKDSAYYTTMTTLVNRKISRAKLSREPGAREEAINEARELVADLKEGLGEGSLSGMLSVAALEKSLLREDLEIARSSSKVALYEAQNTLMFMDPTQRQIYAPYIYQSAMASVAEAFRDIYQNASQNLSSACFGVNSSGSRGMFSFMRFSRPNRGPQSVEDRIACGAARSSFNEARLAVTTESQMVKAEIERASKSTEVPNASGLPAQFNDRGILDWDLGLFSTGLNPLGQPS